MIVSLNWLSDHLDLTGLSVEELSRLLTFAGVEVERVEQKGVASDKVVVAQILEFGKHPDADKLSVCKVDGGLGTPLQIVCGAKNFVAGDKVPLALEGAVLPGDFTIKKGKLRGVESQGMMCSGRELGLSQDGEGLLILPADAPVGRTLGDYLGSDTIIEIEVTPNRPDLLSHRGLARELGALTGRRLKAAGPEARATTGNGPEARATTESGPEARATSKIGPESGATIRIEASDRCPFYTARIIRGVKVGPSPDWLKRKLESIGLRPINNIVDLTNFVLMDLGQPLHAFDLAKLDGGIVVRMAADGEKLTALDGKEYALASDDLVIADQSRAQALAGVMGGTESGVTETTRDILLESAWFTPPGIRRTSRRLGLSSDSSHRFERGVDPEGVMAASLAATHLILEAACGTADPATQSAGTAPQLTGAIALELNSVGKLLGCEIAEDKVVQILTGLGLKRDGGATAQWLVPSFRQDLQRPVDLIEEVARVAGLDGIPSRTAAIFTDASKPDARYDFQIKCKSVLANLGFFEARTIELVSEKQLDDALGISTKPAASLRLKNPLSDDHTFMRPSLLPGLLAVAERNLRHGAESLRFFEAGTIFAQSLNPKAGASESPSLAILLSGPHAPSSWLKKSPFATDLYDLRGVLEAIIPRTDLRLRKIGHPRLVLAAEIVTAGKVVGLAGQLAPARAREIDASHPVFVAELSLAALESLLVQALRCEELPRFPAITRDVALEVPATLAHGEIDEFFSRQQQSEPRLAGIALFDVFADPKGEKLPADKKSLAYSLTYRDPTRTLEAREVDAAHARIIDALKAKLPASVR